MNEVAEAVSPQEGGQATEEAKVETAPQQEQQTNVGDWKEGLPDEIKNAPSLQSIKDIQSLAKGFVHSQRMVGADKVALLGKYATDDEYNEFYKKIGRPDEPNQYNYEIDEGTQVPDETVTGMSQVFHEAGLTNKQANMLMNKWIESGMGGNPALQSVDEKQIQQHRQETIDNLQKEWGNGYDDNLAIANSVMVEFGNIDLRESKLANGTSVGDHPEIIKMLANVGAFIRDKVSEDKLEGTKMAGGMSVDQAKAKLSELKRPDSPIWDGKHPEHDWYVKESYKYQQIVDGI